MSSPDMYSEPLVSVIMIFLNAADYLEEAVESVLAQTYQNWELLLVDDGSSDASTQIARHYASRYVGKVIYIEHSRHQNRGKSISRNLGLAHAQGEYVAFLDADDVWLPDKLRGQVGILRSYPEAGMVYGNTLYWYSWTGKPEDISKDFIPRLGVRTNILINPPSLLPLYLRGKAAVPCTCSVMVRRSVINSVNGFDELCQEIRNFYEDQAFYSKICLMTPVMAVDICWDQYRQRPSQRGEEIAEIYEKEQRAREFFLNWLDSYMNRCGIEDLQIRQAIRKELWLKRGIRWFAMSEKFHNQTRWAKKWLLRLEELIIPVSISSRFWLRDRKD